MKKIDKLKAKIKKLEAEITAAKADSFNSTHLATMAYEMAVRNLPEDIAKNKLDMAVETYKEAIEARRLITKLTEQYADLSNELNWNEPQNRSSKKERK